jgi:hypothetical protein
MPQRSTASGRSDIDRRHLRTSFTHKMNGRLHGTGIEITKPDGGLILR